MTVRSSADLVRGFITSPLERRFNAASIFKRAHGTGRIDRIEGLSRLLAEYGERDSLGYFATRRDKSAVFSPNGRAAVTYRPVAAVSLASGDPVGDPDAWDGAIEAWLAEAREYGLPRRIQRHASSLRKVFWRERWDYSCDPKRTRRRNRGRLRTSDMNRVACPTTEGGGDGLGRMRDCEGTPRHSIGRARPHGRGHLSAAASS